MSWWTEFDAAEVAVDFSRLASAGFDSVRLFLTWEDFQPHPHMVDPEMLGRLVTVADLAVEQGLMIMPTLFTGHMSGVNWVPTWALGGVARDGRFRVSSGGRISTSGLRNWYSDDDVLRAQVLMAGMAAEALAGHQAMWAWDLGNENSNCVTPETRSQGQRWLHAVSNAIRGEDEAAIITLGLHMEDLEEDRNLGPAEAAEVCDFLTMHGYPIYADWAENETDEHIVTFLAQMTGWLGGGSDVLFSEFGVPTFQSSSASTEQGSRMLIDEQTAASYTARALGGLQAAGCVGAMIWCYTDYDEQLWDTPPFDEATHERFFGVWRADGSPKASLEAVRAFAGIGRVAAPAAMDWIDIEVAEFSVDPRFQIERLYRRFRESG